MKLLSQSTLISFLIFSAAFISGCSPEVGSEAWCANMEETPKGDWTANMATDYAKHCVFKMNDE